MEAEILKEEIQKYIENHLDTDPNDLVLKGIPFDRTLHQAILDQIRSKSKAKSKLPLWYETSGIYYPPPLHLEQTSSEKTAKYKAQLVSGGSLIDLTGGFGVDSHYFAERIAKVDHVELDEKLSQIARNNAKQLGRHNITFRSGDGIQILKDLNTNYDWIYLDPSRRGSHKQKVFLLSDCVPNVKTFRGLFLKYGKRVMIKTSPLLDIKKTLADLEFVTAVHIVAIQNEVKELLWILERDYSGYPHIITKNLTKKGTQTFNFSYQDLQRNRSMTSIPLSYLYEPNSAILKSGAFDLIAEELGTYKLQQHSHLYTSDLLVDFPGRRFTIKKVLPFNKKQFSKEGIKKANITIRNFPMSVHDIRKKLNIKDGGDQYLFFTTDLHGKKVVIITTKT